MRILLVEYDCDLATGTAECIASMGHSVDRASGAKAGDEWLIAGHYQLVVLDLILPTVESVSFVRTIRQQRKDVPVIVLSPHMEVYDRIAMLDSGADDHLVKPFDFRELQAQVRSLLRRHCSARTPELECGGVVYDRTARLAKIDGGVVGVSYRELSLLEIYLARQTQIFSKAQLLDQLSGYNAEPTENSIEVMVGRLRRKLVGAGVQIRTQRGLGYRMVAL